MKTALTGVRFDIKSGFRVVSNDKDRSPLHFGIFAEDADARVYAVELNAEAGVTRAKVAPFTAR